MAGVCRPKQRKEEDQMTPNRPKQKKVTAKPASPRASGVKARAEKLNESEKVSTDSREGKDSPQADHALAGPKEPTPRKAKKDIAREMGESNLVARGKDVLAGEAGGVATLVAIGIGAALIEIELIPGLIIGAGAILLGRLFPQLGGYVRPAVKSAVNVGFAMTQKAREVMAEANEQVQDMVAEVKHERASHPKAVHADLKRNTVKFTDGALFEQ
jgi:hypothetical protein